MGREELGASMRFCQLSRYPKNLANPDSDYFQPIQLSNASSLNPQAALEFYLRTHTPTRFR